MKKYTFYTHFIHVILDVYNDHSELTHYSFSYIVLNKLK